MSLSPLPKKNTTAGDSRKLLRARTAVVRRLEATMATFISPIERWADNNYAPYELDYLVNRKTESVEIVAPLHGFQAQDVHVDMSHGQVLILLSHDDGSLYPNRQEYYCEVPLPPDVKRTDAYIEITPSFLTVRLSKKQSVFKRAASAVYIFKNGFAILFGCQWNFGRLDE